MPATRQRHHHVHGHGRLNTQLITVTITGTDDGSVISGTVTGAVTEGNVGDAPVTATGDSPSATSMMTTARRSPMSASTLGDNSYGSFTLTGGTWIYTLDQTAVQDLDAGDIVNDTITYTATDGSTQQIHGDDHRHGRGVGDQADRSPGPSPKATSAMHR